MRQMLAAIEWEYFLSSLDIQTSYNKFALRLTNIINNCVPLDKGKSVYDTSCSTSKEHKMSVMKQASTYQSPHQITKCIVSLETRYVI